MLLWDNHSESFWSQIEGKAVVGPETGVALTWLDVTDTTYAGFKKDHPKGEVLAAPGDRRRYAFDPYKAGGYDKQDSLPRFVKGKKADKRMHQKATVTGVMIGETAYCVPHKEIEKVAAPLEVKLGEVTLKLEYDRKNDVVKISRKVAPKPEKKTTGKGKKKPVKPVWEKLVALRAYWFAWSIFHPKTEVFEVTEEMKKREG